MILGPNRPKTAAMGGGGLPRPPTAVYKNLLGNKFGSSGVGGGLNFVG